MPHGFSAESCDPTIMFCAKIFLYLHKVTVVCKASYNSLHIKGFLWVYRYNIPYFRCLSVYRVIFRISRRHFLTVGREERKKTFCNRKGLRSNSQQNVQVRNTSVNSASADGIESRFFSRYGFDYRRSCNKHFTYRIDLYDKIRKSRTV